MTVVQELIVPTHLHNHIWSSEVQV